MNGFRGLCLGVTAAVLLAGGAAAAEPKRFPAPGASEVNPDTPLILTFDKPPTIGASGKITITEAATGVVVDTLDLSIPVSPNPTGRSPTADGSTRSPPPPAAAGPDHPEYQFTQIGVVYFHFFPVIVHGNTASIYPHHGALKYGKMYIVHIEEAALPGAPRSNWIFTTKAGPPRADATRVVVSADGRGDFSTVQGAIDFAPAKPKRPLTIFIRNGAYEEIVYLKGKSNLILRGEDREKTVVGYANNSAFNRTRPAFTITDASDVQLSTFTINNYFIGQAEALLVRGERIVIDRMTLNGSGDAMTTYGSIYMVDSSLAGDGDTILAYAALYCLRCDVRSKGPFTWTRTPKGQHGNVFIDSRFIYDDRPLPWSVTPANLAGTRSKGVFARLPRNGPAGLATANFPYAELVMIGTRTFGVPPEGWGPLEEQPAFDWSNLRLMEYDTRDLEGRPVDLSRRHPAVRRLDKTRDAALIADYRRPEFVLGGWKPVVR